MHNEGTREMILEPTLPWVLYAIRVCRASKGLLESPNHIRTEGTAPPQRCLSQNLLISMCADDSPEFDVEGQLLVREPFTSYR